MQDYWGKLITWSAMIILCTLHNQRVYALNDARDLILSLPEKTALLQLKQHVTPFITEEFMLHDFYLVRWIRETNLNVPAAQDRLIKTMQWRKNNNISSIQDEDWSDLSQDYSMNFSGQDRDGRPILEIDMGDWDLRSAVISGKTPRVDRYLEFGIEKIMRQILKVQQDTGKSVTRALILVDVEGLNIRQHLCPACLTIFSRWTTVMESYYPRFTDEIVIINAPGVISLAMSAVRPFMSTHTRDQFNIFNTVKSRWMHYLDKRARKDERSVRYGGTRKE